MHSVILYGLETWSVKTKVERFMERVLKYGEKFLKTDKVCNQNVLRRLWEVNIVRTVWKQKTKWIARILRHDYEENN